MTRAALSTLLLCLTGLVGCAGLTGPREDYTIYALDPATAPGQGPMQEWQLLIERPHMSDLLDGFRIVVAPGGNERQVYRGARWVEQTPSLLQGIWLRGFEADGRLPGAARSGTGVRADLILATDLTDFQARYREGDPVIEVEVHARLVDPRGRRIMAREVFRAEAAAEGIAIAPVVAAFETALAEVTAGLIEWTILEGGTALEDREPRPGRERH